jgi:glutamyl endopeptidase
MNLSKKIAIASFFISLFFTAYESLAMEPDTDREKNGCIRRILDDSIGYEYASVDSRVLKSKKKLHSPEKLSSKSYEEPYESIVNREDGRTRVVDTTSNPYRFHGHLIIRFEDGKEAYGSGTIVGRHHVLTAGHNIFDAKRGWARSIKFVPGKNEGISPYGELNGTRIYTFNEWVKYRSVCHDMALITLDKSIGRETGKAILCLSTKGRDLLKEKIEVSGYPGDKNPSLDPTKWQMWTMSGKVKEYDCHRIFYKIDSYKGQSGIGILMNHKDHYCLAGVHVRGEENGNKLNSGVRLSNTKMDNILEWIAETKHIIKVK